MSPKDLYASFMLRLQWTQNDDKPTWVVSMQSSKTGELRRFASLDTFVRFLQCEFGEQEAVTEAKPTLDEQNPKEADQEQVRGFDLE